MSRAGRSCAALVLAAVAALPAGQARGAARGQATGPLPRLAGETVMGALWGPPDAAFLARVRRGELGGVILMGTWSSRAAVRATTARLQRAACVAGEPLLVATDQEGGTVRRLSWAAPALSAAALGRLGSTARVAAQGRAAGRALRAAGVGVDLAPVADTPTSASSFLGSRAFSHDAGAVARLASAFARGLQAAGVAATAKHFPGLGAAPGNTDLAPVTVRASAAALRRGLLPFRRTIAAGARLVMVSSASYPALDPSGLPAVYSPRIVGGLLRGRLDFDGVVVTDALDAAAAAARMTDAPARAIAAGADLLLYTSEPAAERGYASLLAAARRSPALRARLARSAARLRSLKTWLADRDGSLFRCTSGP